MKAILDINGFIKEIEIDKRLDILKYPWIEKNFYLDENNERIMYFSDLFGPRPEGHALTFLYSGETESGDLLYEWDGENLFWGDRRPRRDKA